jgi:hypothetical protein
MYDRFPEISRSLLALSLILFTSALMLSCNLALEPKRSRGDRTVNIYADHGWQDTGITLQEGAEVNLTVKSGEWFEDPPGVWHDASGNPDPWVCGDPECHEPLPYEPKYALIAKIGEDSSAFVIGEISRFFAEKTGTLFLRGNYGDVDIPIFLPEGSVEVRIEFDEDVP